MSSTDPELVLRPAQADSEADVAAVVAVHLAARRAAAPAMPPSVHTDDEVRGWLAERLASDEVWVAELPEQGERGSVVGYARLTREWLDDLYVAPQSAGQGIGSALLELVKAVRPEGFGLWVFESNHGARRFYARHGLREVERTDGAGNEEGAPDIRMVWRPR